MTSPCCLSVYQPLKPDSRNSGAIGDLLHPQSLPAKGSVNMFSRQGIHKQRFCNTFLLQRVHTQQKNYLMGRFLCGPCHSNLLSEFNSASPNWQQPSYFPTEMYMHFSTPLCLLHELPIRDTVSYRTGWVSNRSPAALCAVLPNTASSCAGGMPLCSCLWKVTSTRWGNGEIDENGKE